MPWPLPAPFFSGCPCSTLCPSSSQEAHIFFINATLTWTGLTSHLFSGRSSPPALPPLPLKHNSQNCRRKNKMEFGLCCFSGSYLISFHELCLHLSNKNTTAAGIFFCLVLLIIFLCDFEPQKERQCRVISCNLLPAGRSMFLGTEIEQAIHQTGRKFLNKLEP